MRICTDAIAGILRPPAARWTHVVCSLALVVLLATLVTTVAEAADPAAAQFDSTIAPLLARRCLECHNAIDRKGGLNLERHRDALAGGDSGSVIAPGKPDESLFWERVAGEEMPPEERLTDEEKQTLRAWIAAGAEWGADPIDVYRFTSDRRAGYDWWALQPVSLPPVPSVTTESGVHSPVDRFVQSRLEAAGLSPAPEADRRVLIRRLSYDLLGLPPRQEEVEAFVSDPAPDAYERLVDRYLASPAYGERWARHWLDVVRYGESQGFERDKLRPNAWHYRDWVAVALNRDLPYDEFVKQQLAGDLRSHEDHSALIATGFLVAGPYDEVGQSQQSEAMRRVVRQDELEDVVGNVGQTFLGLTVNCARCHDHKFDPIRQREYYQLTAALGGVRHGERDLPSAAIKQLAPARTALLARIAAVQGAVDRIEAPVREQILAERKRAAAVRPPAPQPIARWDFDGEFNDAVGALHGTAHGGARLENGRLVLNGTTAYMTTAPLDHDLTAKTLEVWITVSSLSQRGGGALSLQTLDGGMFDAVVFGERDPAQWMAGSDGFRRTQSFEAPPETEAEREVVQVAVTYAEDGTITGYRNGEPYGKPYKSDGPVTFRAGEAQFVFGLRHSPPGGNRILAGAIDKALLYDRALSAGEVTAAAGIASETISENALAERLSDDRRELRKTLLFEADQLRRQLERIENPKLYAVVPQEPATAHVLHRGNAHEPGEVVAAGGIAALVGLQADFGLAPDAPDAERRRRLAAWIADPANPLTARVLVNRLWHYHFGAGLVETPNDFGFNGGRPSHPELLDWLAAELVRRSWSIKALHRVIVTSATYRQSSQMNDVAAGRDAANRLLWRKSPQRLEAEVLRDSMLLLSGRLDHTLGGPGFEDYRTYVSNSQFYQPVDPVGAAFNRRSLYRTWIRSGRNRFLDVFDCPDPSTATPARAVTTTPLQALSLLNNSFVLRMSDCFAERLSVEETETAGQVRRAFARAYSRSPDEGELEETTAFIAGHGLPAFCRVVFNTNEFLYVE